MQNAGSQTEQTTIDEAATKRNALRNIFTTLNEITQDMIKEIFGTLVETLKSQITFPSIDSQETHTQKLLVIQSFVLKMRECGKIGAAITGFMNIGRASHTGMRLFWPIVIMAIAEAELNNSNMLTSTFSPILRMWNWLSTEPMTDEDEHGVTKPAVYYIDLLSTIGLQEPGFCRKRSTISLGSNCLPSVR